MSMVLQVRLTLQQYHPVSTAFFSGPGMRMENGALQIIPILTTIMYRYMLPLRQCPPTSIKLNILLMALGLLETAQYLVALYHRQISITCQHLLIFQQLIRVITGFFF